MRRDYSQLIGRMKTQKPALKHGRSKTPEYFSWCNMKARCYRKTNPRFKEWGGRGITVCDAWKKDFVAFFRHVGERPGPKYTLDRIDGNRGYEPGNVRWATASQQSSNRPGFCRKIVYDGEIFNLSELSRKFGLDREMLKYRLDTGWDLEMAIKTPSAKQNAASRKS